MRFKQDSKLFCSLRVFVNSLKANVPILDDNCCLLRPERVALSMNIHKDYWALLPLPFCVCGGNTTTHNHTEPEGH